jgi:SAM-dependent methyltransferase
MEFPKALDVGCGPGFIASELDGHGGVTHLTGVDSCEAALTRRADLAPPRGILGKRVVAVTVVTGCTDWFELHLVRSGVSHESNR